jgi:hypothetical protein
MTSRKDKLYQRLELLYAPVVRTDAPAASRGSPRGQDGTHPPRSEPGGAPKAGASIVAAGLSAIVPTDPIPRLPGNAEPVLRPELGPGSTGRGAGQGLLAEQIDLDDLLAAEPAAPAKRARG